MAVVVLSDKYLEELQKHGFDAISGIEIRMGEVTDVADLQPGDEVQVAVALGQHTKVPIIKTETEKDTVFLLKYISEKMLPEGLCVKVDDLYYMEHDETKGVYTAILGITVHKE